MVIEEDTVKNFIGPPSASDIVYAGMPRVTTNASDGGGDDDDKINKALLFVVMLVVVVALVYAYAHFNQA